MPPDRKLGLIAGAGSLPQVLVDAARSRDIPVLAVGFKGTTDPRTVEGVEHFWSRAGKAGSILRRFKAAGVTDIVMAGAMRRPSLSELRPDWYTARFYARLGRAALGDDGYLRALTRTIEGEGFHVRGVSDFAPEVLAPIGSLGTVVPDARQQADIDHGIFLLSELGRLDIGQAVVVQQGIVLGVEGAEGTDALIERCGSLKRAGSCPVLIKFSKSQQDLRIDMPTIGLGTLERLSSAGFAGVAIEAQKTILLDSGELSREADRLKLFVVGTTAHG